MFLYLDEGNSEIKVTAEGMALSEVKLLFASDKSTNKVLFREWIKYIYWVYRREGTFSNSLISERRRDICQRFFPQRTWEYFENNDKIKAVIALYMKTQYSISEILYERWKEDVDQYIIYLTSIPYYKVKPVKDGEERIENIEEKLKAQKAIQELVDTGQKMEQKILKEKRESSGKLNPIFDGK